MRHAPRLACVAVLAFHGCADSAPPHDRVVPGAGARVTGPTTLPAVVAKDPRTVTLIAAGAEPRQVLRYRPRIGAKHVFVSNSKLDMEMSNDGHRVFGQRGESRATLSLEVSAVAPNGDITVALTVIDLAIPSFDPTKVGAPMQNLVGARGTFVVSDRGLLGKVDIPFFDAHPDVRDELQLDDFLFALPVEPVGVGASWQIHATGLRNGMTLTTIETHELVALQGSTGRSVVQQKFHGSPQLVPSLAYNALSTFELVSMSSDGTAETQFALEQIIPTASTSRFKLDSQMRIREPNGTQDVSMTMELEFRATARASE